MKFKVVDEGFDRDIEPLEEAKYNMSGSLRRMLTKCMQPTIYNDRG